MTKPLEKFLYACANCRTAYNTKVEALACPKLVSDYFSAGDLIRRNGQVWLLKRLPTDHGQDGLGHIERVRDWLVARGYGGVRGYQTQAWAYPGVYFCKANERLEKIGLKEAKETLALRKKQARAAERIVEYLKERE